uniref:Uncharacterized protein n=1 Tax=Panagrolaimus sp. JU765 TaxID=591449 RepID=A0AC34Q949_9BILA
MGSISQLPAHQLNIAHSGAETDHMPDQAKELIRRLYWMNTTDLTMNLNNEWVLVFVTIGTEELCAKCDEPNMNALKTALLTLRKGIPKAMVVLVGPVHVTKNTALTYNLLKPRCSCLSRISDRKLRIIQKRWKDAFRNLEDEFNRREFPNFEILALPLLEIISRYPETLFISEKPLLNRKGHAYAAKWLWNRMIAGPKYNASKMPLSEDAYYCPSLGCPYFRTSRNLQHCSTITISEYNRIMATTLRPGHLVTHNPKKEIMQSHIVSY